MFCKKCGTELPEGIRFCSNCGTKLTSSEIQQTNKKANSNIKTSNTGSKKKYIIATGTVLGVLVIAVMLFVILVLPNAEVNSFSTQIINREYRDAFRTYDDFDAEDQTKANKWMCEYIDSVENDYYAGKLDYSTATGILEELKEFDAAYNDAVNAGENIYLDNQSAIAFDKAIEYAAEEKWQEAYQELENVHIKYRLYNEVSTLRAECITNVRADALEQINNFAATGEIDKLIAARDNALTFLPDDKEIIQTAQTQLDAFVTKTLTDAKTLADNKDFAGAMDLLKYAVSMYVHPDFLSAHEGYKYDAAEAHCEALVAQNDLLGAVKYAKELADDDSKYNDLLAKYTQPLIDKTLSEAKVYADTREFDKAIRTIANVQKVYDCNEFQSTVEIYTAFLPISLVDCYVVQDTTDWGTTATDSFGKEHSDSLAIWDSEEVYIVYNLDSKYVTLSGEMVHVKGGFYDASVQIKIYLDDELIYTSDEITVTTHPIAFSLDVTGGKLLRIQYETVTYTMWGGGCIIDATLS